MKKCFVICPIGVDGSEVRKRSDQWIRHILTPVLEAAGYVSDRADRMPKPGIITTQIITQLVEAPLVIADLTGANPNVFYELAVRHASRLPYIQMIRRDERIPFDVHGVRTIEYDLGDPDRVSSAVNSLRLQINEIDSGHIVDSPLSPVLKTSLFDIDENALQVFLDKFETIQQSLDQLTDGLKSLRDDVGSLTEDVSSLKDDVSSISSDVSSLESSVRDIERNLED